MSLETRITALATAIAAAVNARALLPGSLIPAFRTEYSGALLCDGQTDYLCNDYVNLCAGVAGAGAAGEAPITVFGSAAPITTSSWTFTRTAHGLVDDDLILIDTNTLFDPYDYPYAAVYVISSTTNTFEVALTQGGTKELTSNAAGDYYTRFKTADLRAGAAIGAGSINNTYYGASGDPTLLGVNGGSESNTHNHPPTIGTNQRQSGGNNRVSGIDDRTISIYQPSFTVNWFIKT